MKKFIALALSLFFCVAQARATITNVTETHSSTSITLTWNTSLPEFNPVVKYSQGSSCSLTMTATGTSDCRSPQTVTISGLAPGTQYCLRPQGQFCAGLSTDLGSTLLVTTNSSDTPTVTKTATPTRTATRTITATSTPTVTPSISPTSTASPTRTPSFTTSPTPSASPTRTSTASPTATPVVTVTNLRLVKDGNVFTYSGNGQLQTIPLTYQPVQIVGFYLIDLTSIGFPKMAYDSIFVNPEDFADARNYATADIVVSFDYSKNLVFSDGGSNELTSGHQYRLLVQYLAAP